MLLRMRICSMITVIALALSVMPLPVSAQESEASDAENYYQELAGIISSKDDSSFFSEMTLTIGSDILTVDGERQILDAAPEIEGNRTMLPIRAIAEAAGASVDYDPDSHSALITSRDGDRITCPIGTNRMTVNGRDYQLDVTSYTKKGRTFLPVRAVSEAMGFDVEWLPDASSVSITAPYQSARLLVFSDYDFQADRFAPLTTLYDGNGMWVLQFRTAAEAKDAADRLISRHIECEPDYYIAPSESERSAVAEVPTATHCSWGVSDCHFDDFLSKCPFDSGTAEIVAVVDSGVDSTHPLLREKTLYGFDLVDGGSPYDESGHGTHVASTVVDCVGEAPVKILPVRVLGKDGFGYISVVSAGIKYAADHGADVINLSLGGSHSSAQERAIEYALGKGCIVTISAGNDDSDIAEYCPAHIAEPGVVVVSAGDMNHQRAGFSNYGASVDLMAPGSAINGAVPGGGYALKWGTSMAAPHATAAAALLDLAWERSLSPADLERKLYTATSNGRRVDNYYGYGFLDMSKASIPSPVKKLPTIESVAAPENLRAAWIDRNWSAEISWDAVENASSYDVEYSHDGTDWKPDPDYHGGTSYVSRGVGYSGYLFRVRAVNGNLMSEWTSIVHDQGLPAPTSLTAAWNEPNWSATVSWTAVEGADYYEVEYSHDGTDWKPDPDYRDRSATSFISWGVGYSGYRFRVRAFSRNGNSEWTATVCR